MLRGTSHPPDKVVGRLRPTAFLEIWEFTVEKVAVNAVMAGARPEYFPVILALASSGISARSSSTNSFATISVVNGPIRNEIDMNSGIGVMGPYNHANSTIGRAYGLLSQNLPWGLVMVGVCITLTLELCGIHSLSFAVGSYLPISTTAPIYALESGVTAFPYDPSYYPTETLTVGGNLFIRRAYIEKVQNGVNGFESVDPFQPDTGMKKITVYVMWQPGGAGPYRMQQVSSLYSNPSRQASAMA